ncbi:MAG: tetratricopeptide repeat protein [Cyanobacteria bacterium TGS_CYA1]|nr:tetratricopeptide repeat protein [Cyanobacteria bacterium TGS_CYA1]
MPKSLIFFISLILCATLCSCAYRGESHDKALKETAQTMVEKGSKLLSERKYDDANQMFQKALELDPRNDNAYVFKSNLHLQKNENEQALADATSALKLNKDNVFGYVNRACALINLKEYKPAMVDCSKAIEKDPTFYSAFGNRGVALFYLGEYKEAVRDLTIAIQKLKDKDAAQFYFVRGQCFTELGKDKLSASDKAKSRELGYNFTEIKPQESK